MKYIKLYEQFINESIENHKYRININQIRINNRIISLTYDNPLYAKEIILLDINRNILNQTKKLYITRFGDIFDENLNQYSIYNYDKNKRLLLNFNTIYEYCINNNIIGKYNIFQLFKELKDEDIINNNLANNEIDILYATTTFYFDYQINNNSYKIPILRCIYETFINDVVKIIIMSVDQLSRNIKINNNIITGQVYNKDIEPYFYFLKNKNNGILPFNIIKGKSTEQKKIANKLSIISRQKNIEEKYKNIDNVILNLFKTYFPTNYEDIFNKFIIDLENGNSKKSIILKYKIDIKLLNRFIEKTDNKKIKKYWTINARPTMYFKNWNDQKFLEKYNEYIDMYGKAARTIWAKDIKRNSMTIYRRLTLVKDITNPLYLKIKENN